MGQESSAAQGNWSVYWATPPQRECDVKEERSNSGCVMSREEDHKKHDPCSPETVLRSILSKSASKGGAQLQEMRTDMRGQNWSAILECATVELRWLH